MSEAIYSDNTSTYESLYTDTTLIINTSKCVICDKLLGYQGRFSLSLKYHSACLEDKQCLFCGSSGINTLCTEKSCQNVFHIFCLQRNTKKFSLNEIKCPYHTECKKSTFSHLSFKKIANSIQNEEQKLNAYKENFGEIKAAHLSHGQIFWAIIGAQYFPESAKLHHPPIIYQVPFKSSGKIKEKSWVASTLKSLSKDYKLWKNKNFKNFKEFLPAKVGKSADRLKLVGKTKDQLPLDCRMLSAKLSYKDFIKFLEKNSKPASLDPEDDICEICQEIDYDDDDLIIKCNRCQVKVHMQCYGILNPEKDWVCQQCLSSYQHKSVCALCPVIGGVLKPTLTTKSPNFDYLPHPADSVLWVHVFCATHIDPECIKNKIKMENISLQTIDRKKFTETCTICKTTNGACVKCLYSRCRAYFHPECGKKQFLFTRNHSGFDIVGIYCEAHKTSKLRQTMEIKENQLYSDFLSFIKYYEKLDKVCEKKPSITDFSYMEKYKIFKNVDRFLAKRRGKFELAFKCNRLDKSLRAVIEDSVDACTLVEPKDMSEEDFPMVQHEAAEVQEFYSKNIFEIMKQELKILKLPLISYKKKEIETKTDNSEEPTI